MVNDPVYRPFRLFKKGEQPYLGDLLTSYKSRDETPSGSNALSDSKPIDR